MNNNMKLFLELVANANGFKSEMGQSKNAVSRFVSGAKSELASLKRAFGSIQGQLAGIGLGFGAVKIMTDSARLDKSLTQIGQTAGESAGQVISLRKEIFSMAKESGQQVESLNEGFNNLIQSGLSWKASLESTKGINIASAVTGASQGTLAGGLSVGATAFNIDLEKPGKALELLDKMTVAGRLGNAELQNLADIFSRVGVNASSAGMGFDKTLAFIEGLSMVERQPERLATLADSTLRLFNNMRYSEAAQEATGVSFFNSKGGRRDPVEVLKDFRAQYSKLKTDEQRANFVQNVLGKADLDTIKGFRTLMQGDNLEKIGKFTSMIESAGGTLKKDFDEATKNLIDQGGRIKNVLREAADGFVKPLNETMAQFIQFMLDKKENGGWELSGEDMMLGGAGIIGGTALLARYGSKGLGGLANKLRNKGISTGTGVLEGKFLEAAAGITPVFVTNWPTNLGGSNIVPEVAGDAAGAAGKSKWIGKGLKYGKYGVFYGLPGLVGGAGIASYYTSRHMQEGTAAESEYWQTHRQTWNNRQDVMGIGGVKNDITLNLRIDKDGRVISETNDMNTKARINLKRGDLVPN